VEDYVKGGFRDPFIWREGTTWQMIACGAIRGVGGTVLYFRSEDLINWTYVKPLLNWRSVMPRSSGWTYELPPTARP